ncbi:MAG: ATP-binding protein [Actinomycetota bacterium]|nr:ATP-binding protein [Actinomycetota bacterium]
MVSASTTLPPAASSVPTARRWAESLLTGWGHPDAGWTAACIVSELAANCALHARTTFTLAVTRSDKDWLLLEISDGSTVLPRPRLYGTTSTTGRGLRIVDAMSDGWGVEPRSDGRTGKTVWVRLSTRAQSSTDDEDDLDTLVSRFGDASGADVASLPDRPAGRGGLPVDRLLLAA